MEKWEKALHKFLEDWRNRKEVLGAVVTGSYVIGNQTKFSDIDVHIILSDKVNWRERGNKIVEGFLIEYFANPPRQIKKYQEEDYENGSRTDARMHTIGKIIFDKTGIAKKLQAKASRQMQKRFKRKGRAWVETKKYSLWDNIDSLKDLLNQKSSSFAFVYYIVLENIFEIYAKFLGVEISGPAKIYKAITNEQFRKKYRIEKFPDKRFINLAKGCIEEVSFEKIEKLTNYVLEKMGGFNIDGWKLRTRVE